MTEQVKKRRSPEELLELMETTASEFEVANRAMRNLERKLTLDRAKTKAILLARATDLIKNAGLKLTLEKCLKDDKFKFTGDILDEFVLIENQDDMVEYLYQEKISKQAKEENEMWGRQLMWYQSKNKLRAAELANRI